MATGYANPDVLVSTDWVQEHLKDTNVRIVESDEDVLLYDTGHIPGAVRVDWHTELQDQLIRDYIDVEGFNRLMSERGISKDTTVVFYGDKNNWWACYAFWTFKMFEHEDCRIMNGGRQKWLEEKRPLSKDTPQYPRTGYKATGIDYTHRAFRDDVVKHLEKKGRLVDVRSPGEYSGELLHMPDYPQEGSLRGGHIPTAVSIPWSYACNADGTFKSAEELEKLYAKDNNVQKNDDVVVYCRIGERSALSWFVLHYLLGYGKVRNYDGSWTEWGNLVRAPIERPAR